MERKPSGFWKKGQGKAIVVDFVQGKIDEDTAVARVREACVAAGMKGEYELSDATLRKDVHWYARKLRKALAHPSLRGQKAAAQEGQEPLAVEWVTIGQGGRLVIPAQYRDALGLKEGVEVTLRIEEGELRLTTPEQALKRAQALIRKYVPANRSLADELIAERRREAHRE